MAFPYNFKKDKRRVINHFHEFVRSRLGIKGVHITWIVIFTTSTIRRGI